MKDLIKKWNSISLIKRIICGLIIGLVLGLVVPQASVISILGTMFVGALKGIAPLLVFFLVMSALCHMKSGQKTNLKFIIILYMVGNLVSAFVAVIACRLFPVTLTFTDSVSATDITPPSGIAEVLTNLLNNLVKNPVDSIVNANYIGILFWAVIFGNCIKTREQGNKRCTGEHFRCNGDRSAVDHQLCSVRYHGSDLLYDLRTGTGCITFLWKINPRPGWKYGCCYLHYQPGHCIYFHKQNPFPLVFTCLKESFITAFFTRSSAAIFRLIWNFVKKLGSGRGYLLYLHSARSYDQHGRGCDHNLCYGIVYRSYTGYPCRFPYIDHPLCPCSFKCRRCFWSCRWIFTSDPYGLQSLRCTE